MKWLGLPRPGATPPPAGGPADPNQPVIAKLQMVCCTTGPNAYLRSVLAKIATTPMSQIDQFLPEKWKAEDAHDVAPPLL